MIAEQYDEVEREIMTSYRLMKDYRELNEPEMAGFHEHRMNNALVQWGDLHKFLGNAAAEHLTSQ